MPRLCLGLFTTLIIISSFSSRKKSKLKLPDTFSSIPAGTFYYDSQAIKMESFYISRYEVTNAEYRNFYNEVSPALTAAQKNEIACDTAQWSRLFKSDPMKDYYYSHPAYKNFPVVNVRFEAALQYCEWLEKRIQKENPGYVIDVRLPSHQQWMYAASGKRSQAMFPWGNYYLRNRKGEFLCNFRRVGDQSIIRSRTTGKPEVHDEFRDLLNTAMFTASVKSFYPNDFDLYNMCGNVAEMIDRNSIAAGGSWNDYGGDVHIRSTVTYDGPAPTIGFRPLIIAREK